MEAAAAHHGQARQRAEGHVRARHRHGLCGGRDAPVGASDRGHRSGCRAIGAGPDAGKTIDIAMAPDGDGRNLVANERAGDSRPTATPARRIGQRRCWQPARLIRHQAATFSGGVDFKETVRRRAGGNDRAARSVRMDIASPASAISGYSFHNSVHFTDGTHRRRRADGGHPRPDQLIDPEPGDTVRCRTFDDASA